MVKISANKNILSKNDEIALRLRKLFEEKKITVFNFVSSPGSGKTSILEKIVSPLKARFNVGVLIGDLQTDNDARRLRKCGADAFQINTGKGCHLEALSIEKALDSFQMDDLDILIIENVGNLVCPSGFDLGEDFKIVVISVTEGDDKPEKYPTMIRVSDVMIINKKDLLPYVNFNVEKCMHYAKNIKHNIQFFETSCVTGDGIDDIMHWISEKAQVKAE